MSSLRNEHFQVTVAIYAW